MNPQLEYIIYVHPEDIFNIQINIQKKDHENLPYIKKDN